MNFSLELKKKISSHPVTSKQPHKIVQILMRHPVEYIYGFKPGYFSVLFKYLFLINHNRHMYHKLYPQAENMLLLT
jgi:hypothetical protein